MAAIFRHCRTLLKVIAGMVVTFEDISKLKEPVDTLTECKSLWRGLIETAPMGHFIMTDGRFACLGSGVQDLA